MRHWLLTRWVNRRIRRGNRHDLYAYVNGWTTVRRGCVARTVPITLYGRPTPLFVDLDADDQLVGVEILNASRVDIDGRRVK